ncbi:hypothetical protein B0H14DRAFT_2847606, partial [Mycena olivaceomarginata]
MEDTGEPLPLVHPCLYAVALVPALDLMRFLFLHNWTCGRTAPHRLHTRLLLLLLLKRDREAEAEDGRGAEFFQMQSPACAATARSSLPEMVVTRACCTGVELGRRLDSEGTSHGRAGEQIISLGTDEAGVPSRITIPVSIPPHLSLAHAEMQTQPNP